MGWGGVEEGERRVGAWKYEVGEIVCWSLEMMMMMSDGDGGDDDVGDDGRDDCGDNGDGDGGDDDG